PGAAAAAGALPGAAATAVDTGTYLSARLEPRAGEEVPGSQLVGVEAVAAAGPLRWQDVTTGRLPERPGEVAVSGRTGGAVGDALVLEVPPAPDTPDTAEGAAATEQRVEVVGVVDLGGDPSAGVDGRVFALPADVAAWHGEPDGVRVAAAAGTSPAALRDAVTLAVADLPVSDALRVLTGEEAAAAVAGEYTGQSAGLAAVLLTFGAVAVLVAGLVIANTFAVLLAQRTRELALLRCVGARSEQVRRGVLLEAAATGLAGSALGVGAGIGLAAAVSAVVGRLDSPIPLGVVSVPAVAVVAGVVLGTGVTVVSALLPARAATAAALLAALLPLAVAPLRSRNGVLRLLAGLVLFVPSTAALVVLSLLGQLLPAVAAGTGSFLGVLLLAQRAVSSVVALAGRLVAPAGGVPGRIAAGNALRNARRTAATATALVIGVTLTTAMVVGAASTRATAVAQLDAMFPADVVADLGERPGAPVADVAADVAALDGVEAAVPVLRGTPTGGALAGWDVHGVDPAAVGAVLRSPDTPRPAPGVLVLSRGDARALGVAEGGRLELAPGASFRVRVDTESETPALLTTADLRVLVPDLGSAPASGLVWARVDDGLDTGAQQRLVDEVEQVVWRSVPDAWVFGVLSERLALESVVTTMLLVVTGLLAVAVLIALIGVGNTLALSVVERRQESGLLRALGLSRRQLRATLAWEALLVAGVASVLGVLLGAGYGLAGTAAVFGLSGDVVPDVPAVQVVGIVVVGAAAGVLASVVPARRAARTSPVVALAA
ncbi:ABC transporter permease, partial [Kineococcus glutinatus]|uniref:ABC transporter permease n=1 Tax=Kineococcus glutinatus TaxID=1070872 RepID=UPI0031EFA06F